MRLYRRWQQSIKNIFRDNSVYEEAVAALHRENDLLRRERDSALNRLFREMNQTALQTHSLVNQNAELLSVQAELAAQYTALQEANRLLASQATTDGMTGLANHRAFQEELHRHLARLQRTESPLALMLLDVDYFKQYNDTFGHPAGDEVLKMVAKLLRSEVREGDLAARYGGEEFAIILPETDAEIALPIAERIRAAIATFRFPNREITLSIGLAQYFQNEPLDALIQRADVALYEAKSAGRNRVHHVPLTLLSGEKQEEIEKSEVLEIVTADLHVVPDVTQSSHLTAYLSDFAHSEVPRLTGGLEGLLQCPTSEVLAALLETMDRRGVEPQGHSERVTRYALRLAHEVNEVYDELRPSRPLLPRLTPADMTALAFGALFHDIGKAGIPEGTLRKTGKLTDDEWRQIRRHPLTGAEMASGNRLLSHALPVVRYHHERWDGTGYPQGLAGEAIPLVARIFAVCDTLESLTSERSYRSKMDYAQAREEIAREAGTQFDPDVVQGFLRIPAEDWLYLSEGRLPEEELPEALSEAA